MVIVETMVVDMDKVRKKIMEVKGNVLIIRDVNDSSLDEPRLSKLDSFIFCLGSSSGSSWAWLRCSSSSSARQGLNRARAQFLQKNSKYKQENRTKSKKKRRLEGAPVGVWGTRAGFWWSDGGTVGGGWKLEGPGSWWSGALMDLTSWTI